MGGRHTSEKLLNDTAIGIVLISFLFMISGCNYYKVITKKNKEPEKLLIKITSKFYSQGLYSKEVYDRFMPIRLLREKQFYAIDSYGHWLLNHPVSSGDTIYAQAIKSALPPKDNPDSADYHTFEKLDPKTDTVTLKRIKLYVDTLHFLNGDTAVIPFNSIQKYDFYKRDPAHTGGLTFAILGGLALTGLVIGLAVAIANYEGTTVTSCPFIFTHDGNDWQFDGEIFGGAIFRSLERDDYLALNAYNAKPNGKYRIKIANMLEEFQFVNQANLMVVNHDSNTRVLVDKYGQVQTLAEPVLPFTAEDSRGNDHLGEVSVADQVIYAFDEYPDTANHCLNSLTLAFRSASNPDSCKILVTGHNSLWIDHIVKRIFDRLGGKYPIFARIMDGKPADEQKEWVLSQGLPLQVYLQQGQEWHLVDYFDIVGPMESRELVLPLDARDAWTADTTGGIPSYTMNVRLVTGYNFWTLDYAAMDFSANTPVEIKYLQSDQVTDQDGKDVAGLLAGDDRRYLVQRETGNEAIMVFTLPEDLTPSSTLFLHSKGYYHQMPEKNGGSELAFIWDFLKPGRLSEWSYENHLRLQNFLTTK